MGLDPSEHHGRKKFTLPVQFRNSAKVSDEVSLLITSHLWVDKCYMDVSKFMGYPENHPFIDGIFRYKYHPSGDTSNFMETIQHFFQNLGPPRALASAGYSPWHRKMKHHRCPDPNVLFFCLGMEWMIYG